MKVDFYILEESSAQKSLHFACLLIEKAHSEQRQIFIQMNNLAEAERIDTLLWTYKDDSFLPHNIYHLAEEGDQPPIQIGYSENPKNHRDLLFNLSQHIPPFYSQFTHIIEIVFPDPSVQQLARERYKLYREYKCELQTHKINQNAL